MKQYDKLREIKEKKLNWNEHLIKMLTIQVTKVLKTKRIGKRSRERAQKKCNHKVVNELAKDKVK